MLHPPQHEAALPQKQKRPKSHPDSEQLKAALQTLVDPNHQQYGTLQAWCSQPQKGLAPEFFKFANSNLFVPGLTQLSLEQVPTVQYLHAIGFFDEASWQLVQDRLFKLQPSLAHQVCQQVGNTQFCKLRFSYSC